MRAIVAALLFAAVHADLVRASDDEVGRNGGPVYDPATGGLITVEGERERTPRLSGYLEEIKKPVAAQWEPLVAELQGGRKIPKCFTGVRPTILVISLDEKGNPKGMKVHRSSGVEALDEVALLAVRRAQPLPAPPNDILDETGVFQFSIGFNARGLWKWRDPREWRSDPGVPVYAGDCVTPPVALDARCIANGIQLPADYRGQTPASVSIKFAVAKDGAPGEVEVLTSGTPKRSRQPSKQP